VVVSQNTTPEVSAQSQKNCSKTHQKKICWNFSNK